jgi:hypothetical protein
VIAVGLPDPQRSRVVLIGTSKYADEKLPDLTVVEHSVGDMAAALTDPVYGVVPERYCSVLVDADDIRLIGRRLRQAAREAEDLLLVYYSGHGLVSGRRHDLYLALHDSEWADPEFNSLEYDKLRSAVLDSPARTKVIILDCCFSGRVVTDTMTDSVSEVIGQVEVDGTYVLASAQRDQVALVLPGEEHTAFTGRLLGLFRDGVPGGPEFLTVDHMYRQLLSRMKAEGLPEPQRRGTATADSLALTLNRAFAATAAPLLLQRHQSAVERGERGDWAGAAESFRGILAEQTRILGPEHADTLRTRQFLAVNLGEAGYRDEAIAILRVLLPDRRRLLGHEDPDTLRSAHILARNLTLTGGAGEAAALLKEVVAARERILGPNHPHTSRARRDLASLSSADTGRTDV